MSRPRLFMTSDRWTGRVPLGADERRYLVDVLRLGPGDTVEVFDGQTGVCEALLDKDSRGWSLSLGERRVRPETGPCVHLGVALTKGRKLDRVVRMATETGVRAIETFTCERSIARPRSTDDANRIARWKSIVSEAARQAGRTIVPEILPPCPLEALLEKRPEPVRLILHQEKSECDGSLPRLLAETPEGKRLLLVGPEGGFCPRELEAARASGFRAASLDLPVMRAETAAIVVAAIGCLDTRLWVG